MRSEGEAGDVWSCSPCPSLSLSDPGAPATIKGKVRAALSQNTNNWPSTSLPLHSTDNTSALTLRHLAEDTRIPRVRRVPPWRGVAAPRCGSHRFNGATEPVCDCFIKDHLPFYHPLFLPKLISNYRRCACAKWMRYCCGAGAHGKCSCETLRAHRPSVHYLTLAFCICSKHLLQNT